MINQLRAIYIFVKVVELGSFRATAKYLGFSPSVVSYHISQLEKGLQQALIYRSTRKISLTNEGRELFKESQHMFNTVERVLDKLSQRGPEPAGRLYITMPSALARHELTSFIASFARKHPKVELQINYTDEVSDIIGSGIDLALRTGKLADTSLKCRQLMTIPRILVSSPSYIARKPKPISPNDLENWDWIRFRQFTSERIFTNSRGKNISIRFESRLIVDSIDAVGRFLLNGLGLATVPTFLVEDQLSSGWLVEVLPQWRLDPLIVTAIWPANSPRGSLTSRFVEYLANIDRQDSSDMEAVNKI